MNPLKIHKIPLDQIVPDPTQPRKFFDSQKLDELAESIKEHGLLQPILVRPKGENSYQIVYGERRYHAHRKLAKSTINCMIMDIPDSKLSNVRITENVERLDLNSIELAREFQKRVNKGETHEEIADSIKKSRAYVTQRLSLFKLTLDQQWKIESGKMGFAEARLLSKKPKGEDECYTVTIPELEVYKLFKAGDNHDLNMLFKAYLKDLSAIRRALR